MKRPLELLLLAALFYATFEKLLWGTLGTVFLAGMLTSTLLAALAFWYGDRLPRSARVPLVLRRLRAARRIARALVEPLDPSVRARRA